MTLLKGLHSVDRDLQPPIQYMFAMSLLRAVGSSETRCTDTGMKTSVCCASILLDVLYLVESLRHICCRLIIASHKFHNEGFNASDFPTQIIHGSKKHYQRQYRFPSTLLCTSFCLTRASVLHACTIAGHRFAVYDEQLSDPGSDVT